MIRVIVLVAGLVALDVPALAADKAPVPAEMQAAWAKEAHCNKSGNRFELEAFRAGFENGYQGGVHYDPLRRAVAWDDESKPDIFTMAPQGKILIHHMDGTFRGPRETLVRCPGKVYGRRR
jgi:hypothetical protein